MICEFLDQFCNNFNAIFCAIFQYAVLLLSIFLAQLAIGIWAYATQNSVSSNFLSFQFSGIDFEVQTQKDVSNCLVQGGNCYRCKQIQEINPQGMN